MHHGIEPTNPFDPAHFAAVRKPLLEAGTMPPWVYTSEAFHKREVERIFLKCWNFMGHVDQIPNPGDYLALEFVGVPFVICRDESGTLRAFANSCRHRGAKVAFGHGNTSEFVCPYHGWCYGLDGRLTATVDMGRTEGFDNADHGLVPIRVESWGGFIFVNFDPDCETLSEYLGDLPDNLASHNLDGMANTRLKSFDMDCNWKLFVENAKESYHIAMVHRSTINQVASVYSADYTVSEVAGQYCTTFATHDGSMALLKGDPGFPPIESLAGRYVRGTYAPMIYPMTYLACTIDTAWFLQLFPLGPTRTRLVHGACFPRDRTERPDFEKLAANYYKRWDITIMEDIEASNDQQVGISSPLARPGRFSFREPLVHEIDNWILDRVLDAPYMN